MAYMIYVICLKFAFNISTHYWKISVFVNWHACVSVYGAPCMLDRLLGGIVKQSYISTIGVEMWRMFKRRSKTSSCISLLCSPKTSNVWDGASLHYPLQKSPTASFRYAFRKPPNASLHYALRKPQLHLSIMLSQNPQLHLAITLSENLQLFSTVTSPKHPTGILLKLAIYL